MCEMCVYPILYVRSPASFGTKSQSEISTTEPISDSTLAQSKNHQQQGWKNTHTHTHIYLKASTQNQVWIFRISPQTRVPLRQLVPEWSSNSSLRVTSGQFIQLPSCYYLGIVASLYDTYFLTVTLYKCSWVCTRPPGHGLRCN